MTKEEAKQVCTDAVGAWGIEPQVNIAIEEAAELTVALEHFRRGRATMKEVQTEIADVLICCLQLSLIFGEDGVDSEFQSKLERLKGRIERSKQNVSKKEYYGG